MSDDKLKGLVSRIRNLRAERNEISREISAVFQEAVSDGYDGRTLRQLIKRMDMRPEDRSEADALLETYEAAMGMEGSEAPKADSAPRPREVFTAPADASSEEQLKAVIFKVLEMRTERKDMGKAIQIELRKARAIGFSPVKINETCQWLERCDQHGRDKMMQAEELYMIYREIGEGPMAAPEVSGDSKLVAMFAAGPAAPAKAPTLKQKQVGDAIALAQIARMNRGRP